MLTTELQVGDLLSGPQGKLYRVVEISQDHFGSASPGYRLVKTYHEDEGLPFWVAEQDMELYSVYGR